jgi:hypothetical protein
MRNMNEERQRAHQNRGIWAVMYSWSVHGVLDFFVIVVRVFWIWIDLRLSADR